jgi:hypothetical protein
LQIVGVTGDNHGLFDEQALRYKRLKLTLMTGRGFHLTEGAVSFS